MRRKILGAGLGVLAVGALLGWLNWANIKRWAYEGRGRDAWQRPDEVVRALAIPPGARVADLGAGGGYFTFRLARAAGPTGRVYAVDIDAQLLRGIAERTQRDGLGNIETILAEPDDPKLPPDGVDLILVVNTYHHMENHTAYFERVRGFLRPGGRLAIIELSHGGWLAKIFGHSTPREVILSELESAGYRLEQQFDFLPRQHFLVFSARQNPVP